MTANKCRILCLGGSGMLGFAMSRYLVSCGHEVIVTVRSKQKELVERDLGNVAAIWIVDDIFSDTFVERIKSQRLDYVINCVGVVKPRDESCLNVKEMFLVNTVFPRMLEDLAVGRFKLVHVSSDCVFDGRDGNFSEDSCQYSTDVYGTSKRFGEVDGPNSLTLRTSLIGFELTGQYGLLNWFFSQRNQVVGYENFYFSGVTSVYFSSVIERIIGRGCFHSGIYNLAGPRVSKANLLRLVATIFDKNISVVSDFDYKIDRSLDGDLFNKIFFEVDMDWASMLTELKTFESKYLRQSC
jgi:dTDP-4-dehydrorhamnose reductase